ncbi:Hypothetical protein, putative [Bodo saltans]|uniref:Mitochondrial import inner membrane translocase subunit TIM50 n=1 Tax=Bodo saltans TaxID=75058 RepID=A0A0S4JKZ9_BODSA|nr:Hypothetical protein, putative [Bodo saltans]|eukprot:CUG89685.1 Hypothetical protein, putative [Bodo saltans]
MRRNQIKTTSRSEGRHQNRSQKKGAPNAVRDSNRTSIVSISSTGVTGGGGSGSSRHAVRGLTRGMHPSNSAPTLDVTSLLRAARLAAHRTSYDALVELDCDDDDDEGDDSNDDEVDDAMSDATEVVEMLEDAMDALNTSGSDNGGEDRDDDEEGHDEIIFSISLPFGSGGSAGSSTSSPHAQKKRSARKSPCRQNVVKQHHVGKLHPTETFLIPPLECPADGAVRQLTVVLDLDETLVWARNATVVVRPFVAEFLQCCLRNRCEIVLWTAGIPVYVNRIINAISRVIKRNHWFHYVVARSPLWYSDVGPTIKDLRLIHRPLDRVLVLENSPASMQLQEGNVLLVEDFYGDNMEDQSMLFAGQVVERLSQGARDNTLTSVAEGLIADPVLVPLSFLLQADHSAAGKPSEVFSRGLRYTPRPANDHRVYSGIGPTLIGA